MRVLGNLVIPFVVILTGCTAKALQTGPVATGPEAFTPAQVQAAAALCNQSDGPVQMPATYGDLRSVIVGSWYLCSTQSEGSTPSGWGLLSREYDADGQWYSLELDAQGGLVKLQGVDNQGTWDAGQLVGDMADAGDSTPISGEISMSMQFDSGGGNAGPLSFESSPSRMKFEPDYFAAWYVPLGH